MAEHQNKPGGSGRGGQDKPVTCLPPGAGCFEIRVRGQLDSTWSDWFGDLEIRLLENGEMVLSGVIPDQAALMGILNKLNRLNLTLLSVCEVSRKQ